MLSQHAQHRQAIPTYTVKYALYKRGCKSPKQWTSWHSEIAVEPEETCTRGASRASTYNALGGQARGIRHRTASMKLGLEDQ